MKTVLIGLTLTLFASGATISAFADQVVVDGTAYPMSQVLMCEPYEEYGSRQELELQGLHEGEAGRTQIDIAITVMGVLVVQEVSWSGPEGLFSRQGMPDELLFEATDEGVRGDELELADAYGGTDSIRISFDLELPEDDFACR